MFKFFKKASQNFSHKNQIIKFNENYCHSVGKNLEAKTYNLENDVTEITFDFVSFDNFWETYINNNPHIPKELIKSLQNQTGVFCAQVVNSGNTYICLEEIKNNKIIFNAKTMKNFGTKEDFKKFTKGIIAFGIYYPGKFKFDVLWATMYQEK